MLISTDEFNIHALTGVGGSQHRELTAWEQPQDKMGCNHVSMPPHMNELCIDWNNLRGHFRFNGQNRRCVRRRGHFVWSGYHCQTQTVTCHMHIWDETPCTWITKRSDVEYVNGTSPGGLLDDAAVDPNGLLTDAIFVDMGPDVGLGGSSPAGW
ncbi:hypothetical protein QBC34DRAFT_469264 [Podospora aff. communis PSN243]|uniref:Uncharacterized protein n=1 Tax=Podospora aff. communis PSN243 TaxID=3040156 RepID=A0AAV9GHB2_9PEZI|nr:hypothetical protein QBC34DRAFT_469264 [Podospora aff. communis PSN243]